jgi:hypothetical protein
MKKLQWLMLVSIALITSHSVQAAVEYFNGFEPGDSGTRDFYDSTTNAQGFNISIVPNGGGVLGLTAPSGTHYAEITNTNDAYQNPGYGQSVYTDYGAQALGHGVVSSSFYESIKVYINTGWSAAGPNNNNQGFWIDTTPATDPGYLDETNYRIVDTGNGQIGVQMVGLNGTGSTTITSSGWYTFETTFENDGSGNVLNVMSVTDSVGNVVGSYSADSSLLFADLTGTSYGDWFTVWENDFANNVLAIDDVEVGTLGAAPEASSFVIWSVFGFISGCAVLISKKRAQNMKSC